MASYKRERNCPSCFPIKQFSVCNGLAEAIEKLQEIEIEKAKRHVSKPKVVEKILREYFSLKATGKHGEPGSESPQTLG